MMEGIEHGYDIDELRNNPLWVNFQIGPEKRILEVLGIPHIVERG